jgi:succinoglycan biosynthesis transport protein ExoP
MYHQYEDSSTQRSNGHPMPQIGVQGIDFHRVMNLLRAKAWIVASVAIASLLAAVVYLVRAPKMYESRAVVQVQQEPQKVVKISDVSEEKPEADDYLNTVVQAFTSRKLMLRVVRATGLDKDPTFAPPKKSGSPYTEIELAELMSQKVEVSLRRKTRLVDITVFDRSPEMAQQLAGAVVTEFLRETFEQRRALSRLAKQFLQEEAQELRTKLEQAERKLQGYKEQTQAVSLEERQNIIVAKLRELNSKATDAKGARLSLEADLEQLKSIDPRDVEKLLEINSVTQIPRVAFIREELLKAENELTALVKRYRPNHPRYIAAVTKIADLKGSLADTLSKARDTVARACEKAAEAEKKLNQTLQEQEKKALELNKIAIPYNVLQRDVESDRALFESVTLRLKETNITEGIESAPFRVIEEPLAASYPSKPRKKLILALSLVFGVTLGAGIVIGLDVLDSSLRTVDEAEDYLELPVLASIPDRCNAELIETARKMISERDFRAASILDLSERFLKRNGHHRFNGVESGKKRERNVRPIVSCKDSDSEQAEAFRTLRTSISLLGKQSEYRSFLFTSAIPSEGKTFTCLNFALSLAQQGLRTLIIDADMREPRLQRDLLEDEREISGLSELLSRKVPFDKFLLKPTKQENLVLLPAGRRASDPAELLDNKEFNGILERSLHDFDRVVIDSPPVNSVSDVLLIAAFAHATCLVSRAGRTPKRAVRRALLQLEKAHAKVVGVIFNRLPVGGASAGYYYYHYGNRYSKNGAQRATDTHVSTGRSTQ